jgi:hypothetical protein
MAGLCAKLAVGGVGSWSRLVGQVGGSRKPGRFYGPKCQFGPSLVRQWGPDVRYLTCLL